MSSNPHFSDDEYEIVKNELTDFYSQIVERYCLGPKARKEMREILDNQLLMLSRAYKQAINEPTGKFPLVPLDIPAVPRPSSNLICQINKDGALFILPDGWFQRPHNTKFTEAVHEPALTAWAAERFDTRTLEDRS